MEELKRRQDQVEKQLEEKAGGSAPSETHREELSGTAALPTGSGRQAICLTRPVHDKAGDKTATRVLSSPSPMMSIASNQRMSIDAITNKAPGARYGNDQDLFKDCSFYGLNP
jgi:hypothetical protein